MKKTNMFLVLSLFLVVLSIGVSGATDFFGLETLGTLHNQTSYIRNDMLEMSNITTPPGGSRPDSINVIDGLYYVTDGLNNLYSSTDLQDYTLVKTFDEGNITSVYITDSGIMYLCTDPDTDWITGIGGAQILRSTNYVDFVNVHNLTRGYAELWSWSSYENQLLIGEYGPDNGTVWKSSNNGFNYEIILEMPKVYRSHVHKVAIDPWNPTNYWVSGSDNSSYMDIWVSKDSGINWENFSKKSVYPSGTSFGIGDAIHPTDIEFTEDYVFFGHDIGTYTLSRTSRDTIGTLHPKTRHSVASWGTGYFSPFVYDIDITSDEIIYYAVRDGNHDALFASPDLGENWAFLYDFSEISAGYGPSQVIADESADKLYIIPGSSQDGRQLNLLNKEELWHLINSEATASSYSNDYNDSIFTVYNNDTDYPHSGVNSLDLSTVILTNSEIIIEGWEVTNYKEDSGININTVPGTLPDYWSGVELNLDDPGNGWEWSAGSLKIINHNTTEKAGIRSNGFSFLNTNDSFTTSYWIKDSKYFGGARNDALQLYAAWSNDGTNPSAVACLYKVSSHLNLETRVDMECDNSAAGGANDIVLSFQSESTTYLPNNYTLNKVMTLDSSDKVSGIVFPYVVNGTHKTRDFSFELGSESLQYSGELDDKETIIINSTSLIGGVEFINPIIEGSQVMNLTVAGGVYAKTSNITIKKILSNNRILLNNVYTDNNLFYVNNTSNAIKLSIHNLRKDKLINFNTNINSIIKSDGNYYLYHDNSVMSLTTADLQYDYTINFGTRVGIPKITSTAADIIDANLNPTNNYLTLKCDGSGTTQLTDMNTIYSIYHVYHNGILFESNVEDNSYTINSCSTWTFIPADLRASVVLGCNDVQNTTFAGFALIAVGVIVLAAWFIIGAFNSGAIGGLGIVITAIALGVILPIAYFIVGIVAQNICVITP